MTNFTAEKRRLLHLQNDRQKTIERSGMTLVHCARCGVKFHIGPGDEQLLFCAACHNHNMKPEIIPLDEA
jgi:hypothetical protein